MEPSSKGKGLNGKYCTEPLPERLRSWIAAFKSDNQKAWAELDESIRGELKAVQKRLSSNGKFFMQTSVLSSGRTQVAAAMGRIRKRVRALVCLRLQVIKSFRPRSQDFGQESDLAGYVRGLRRNKATIPDRPPHREPKGPNYEERLQIRTRFPIFAAIPVTV